MDNERRRSDALHDVARRLGVEITYVRILQDEFGGVSDDRLERPRLDIAMECWKKIRNAPFDPVIIADKLGWEYSYADELIERDTCESFEEAVIALAERFLASESRCDS